MRICIYVYLSVYRAKTSVTVSYQLFSVSYFETFVKNIQPFPSLLELAG